MATEKMFICLCFIILSHGTKGNHSGLYFQLNGAIYLPGEVIKISDIGVQPDDRSNPGSTLVCMTENVNTACCRRREGISAGYWHYPNGTEVPLPKNGYSLFYAIRYINQVRLTRQNNALGPLGSYTCSVPDPEGNIWNASIYLSGQNYVSLNSTKHILKPGESVTFACFVVNTGLIGTSNTLIRPDGSQVNSSTPDITVNDQQDHTRVYTIASVKPSHAGLYSCIAHNNMNIYVPPASRELYVQLQAPLSVLLLPLQPIYATSSINISYHIQLLQTLNVPSYFNIQWITPTNSTQVLQEKNVSATGRNYYEGFISLQNMRSEDQGKYTCKVQMISAKQYIVVSNFSIGVIQIKIKDIPSIGVFITATKKAERNSLYLLICTSTTSEINFIYTSKFQWYHSGVRLNGRTTRVLHLASLALSDVGNYTCRVKATSRALGRPIMEESLPHTIILKAPDPVSLRLTASPHTVVYQGNSLQLNCIIVYSPNVDVNMTVNNELHGPSITMIREAVVMSTNRYEASFIIKNTTSKHTGNYSCSAVASGISISPSTLYTSNILQINSVGPPLTPILCDVDQSDTYIHITWIISEEDKVEHFQLHYSYTIRGCVGLNGTNYFVLSNITRSYNLSNLEENSDFFIALTAVNQAGKSNPATIQTYTLQAAPTKPPANIRPITLTSTSISFTWDPIPCSFRNTNITGYNITYIQQYGWFFNVAVNLGITDVEYMKATGLIPGTPYTFVVTPIHDFYDSTNYNGLVILNTTISKGLGFFVNGLLLPNNSIIEASAIGMKNKALFCLTNLANCCRYPYSYIKGDWIFPNNTRVLFIGYRYIFTRSRLSSSVILHHMHSTHGYNEHSGLFTCKIPDSDEKYQNLYIHIAEHFSDIYISEIDYNRQFKYLTCVSSGRPVNSWEWLRDGKVINKNDSNYNQTQVITNYTAPTYVHSLSSEDMVDTKGRFSCVVRDSEGNTDRKTIMINNCPPGKYGAVAFDGSTVCVPCPANSMSTSVGSNGCGCLLGYYRNQLEDKHFPCSRPPSNCRGLRVKEESYGSAFLEWSRPYIQGRPDLYYNVYIKDSKLSEKYMKSNSYPVVSDSAKVQYELTGLLPLTNYQMKVCVNNGVSGSYESAERASCEVSWTTSNNIMGPPQSVIAVCGMVAWQAPSTASNELITGYDVHVTLNELNQTLLISKKNNQFYHHFFQDDLFLYNSNQNFTALIKVRATISTDIGVWSKTVSMRCPH